MELIARTGPPSYEGTALPGPKLPYPLTGATFILRAEANVCPTGVLSS